VDRPDEAAPADGPLDAGPIDTGRLETGAVMGPCGARDMQCCEGGACNSGHVCAARMPGDRPVCLTCGGNGQLCCAFGVCPMGRLCLRGPDRARRALPRLRRQQPALLRRRSLRWPPPLPAARGGDLPHLPVARRGGASVQAGFFAARAAFAAAGPSEIFALREAITLKVGA
jgi:hypothetical protein